MSTRQYAHVNPQVLVWARESINLTLEEAAHGMGIETERLASWEEGKTLPTVNQLREATRLYKRPLAAFFLPEPPKDFHVPHDFRRLPGDPPSKLSAALLIAIRRAHFCRQLALELVEEKPSEASEFLGSATLSVNIDRLSHQTRSSLGISLEEQMKFESSYEALNRWRSAVEKLDVLVFHFSDVDLDEVRGFSFTEWPFPVIALNAKDAPNGRIFTLIHEFGHLLLRQGGSCNLREYERIQSANQRVERFCNAFAGAVLVPENTLRQQPIVVQGGGTSKWSDSDISQLAKTFRVSGEVILRRLLILGKTDEPFYRSKRRQWQELAEQEGRRSGGFLSVPRKVLRDVGRPFANLVFDAYHREAITSSDVAEYLGTRVKHFQEIEELLSGSAQVAQGEE